MSARRKEKPFLAFGLVRLTTGATVFVLFGASRLNPHGVPSPGWRPVALSVRHNLCEDEARGGKSWQPPAHSRLP